MLTLSGLQMTARREGGSRRMPGRARGTGAQRLYVGLGKLAANGGPALPADRLAALQGIELGQLRELTFPDLPDPADGYGLRAASGGGFVDPVTGQMLAW